MALFHNLGRFEQCANYRTFEEATSENHAGLRLRELAKHLIVSVCTDAEQCLITRAIGLHNVRALPHDEDQRTLFFAKLLRDADKLDIWQLFIMMGNMTSGTQPSCGGSRTNRCVPRRLSMPCAEEKWLIQGTWLRSTTTNCCKSVGCLM